MPRGRPNAYKTKIEPRLKEIIEWARAGATNAEIASALGVGRSTFCDHVAKNKDLSDSLEEARLSGVPAVKMALFKRAVGFTYEEKKISRRKDEDGEIKEFIEITTKEALPDVSAIQVFLRNNSEDFRDKDSLTNEFKRMEIDLRKQIAENQNF